jgi:hypothetical protein
MRAWLALPCNAHFAIVTAAFVSETTSRMIVHSMSRCTSSVAMSRISIRPKKRIQMLSEMAANDDLGGDSV